MLGHTGKLIIFLLMVLLSKNVTAGATDWLMKINSAAADVNFSGTFVYIHDGKVDVMEVARRVTKGGMIQEHLRSLNGPSREIVRDMDDVWYYIPNQHTVVHDYRQTPWRGFSKILASDFQQLKRLYRFVEGEDMRIANRLIPTAQGFNTLCFPRGI